MSGCTVQFYCPPMRIWPAPDAGLFFHRTDAEPMVAMVMMDGIASIVTGVPGVVCEQFLGTAKKTFTISAVTIPPTLSRPDPDHPLVWWVDACVGEGSDGGRCDKCISRLRQGWMVPGCPDCHGSGWLGNRVRVELPAEKVRFHRTHLIAEAIDAPTTLWLADGRIFRGSVTFPDVKISDPLFNPVAEATTTTGGLLNEVQN